MPAGALSGGERAGRPSRHGAPGRAPCISPRTGAGILPRITRSAPADAGRDDDVIEPCEGSLPDRGGGGEKVSPAPGDFGMLADACAKGESLSAAARRIFAAIACPRNGARARRCRARTRTAVSGQGAHFPAGGVAMSRTRAWRPPSSPRILRAEGEALIGPFLKFSARDAVEWFESRGVRLKTESDGRVFPVSTRRKPSWIA